MSYSLTSIAGKARRPWLAPVAWLLLIIFSIPAQALQDPTRPTGFESAPAQAEPRREFTLSSIIIGGDRRVAVIDGQPRREGQVFDGVRLKRIYPGRVELVERERSRVLHLDTIPQVRSTQ